MHLEEVNFIFEIFEEREFSLILNVMAYDNQNEVKDEVVSNIAPFDPTKKKKKKKVVIQDTVDDSRASFYPWERNTYEELLDRAFNILRDRENNLELADKCRIILRPPHVLLEVTKQNCFCEFHR